MDADARQRSERGYCPGPFGQMHWHGWGLGQRSTNHSDLYCLHPSPYSGAAFNTLAPHLIAGRRVVAPDYPGFGASDPASDKPSITDFALAAIAVSDTLSPNQPIDVLGFHTGSLVAAEMALLRPDQVNNVVLVDIPAFEPETRAQYKKELVIPHPLPRSLDALLPAWDFNVTNRLDSLGLDRAVELFVEQLRPMGNMNAAFYAAFSHDVEAQLAELSARCLLIATQSILLKPTRRAAKLLANAELVEKLHITQAVLDEAAVEIAQCTSSFLDDGV